MACSQAAGALPPVRAWRVRPCSLRLRLGGGRRGPDLPARLRVAHWGTQLMDRNLILAIVLTTVILMFFQYYTKTTAPPPAKKPPKETVQPQQPDVSRPEPLKKAEERAPERIVETERRPGAPEAPKEEAPAVEVKIDALTYEAVISSKGARIVSFKLKDYKKAIGSNQLVDVLNPGVPGAPATAVPSLVFVPDSKYEDTDDCRGSGQDPETCSLNYQCDSPDTLVKLDEKGQQRTITFRATTQSGIVISKTFTFHAHRYWIDFSFSLTNETDKNRNYLITLPLRKTYVHAKDDTFAWDTVETMIGGEWRNYYFDGGWTRRSVTVRNPVSGQLTGRSLPGQVQWAGLGDRYFFEALVFPAPPTATVNLFELPKSGNARVEVSLGAVDLPTGTPVTRKLGIYLGPKDADALKEAGHGLTNALYYSDFPGIGSAVDYMAVYMMEFLRLCNSGFSVVGIKVPGTGNWGLDIIILTVLVKILTIPLTHKSMKSMKKMQELQPEMAKLKEKYKDDKVALQKATMEMWREHKASPWGGCWPMFLQIPIFIALYNVFAYAIELRQANFVCIPSIYFCIKDLSAPDPYYVTPILMGASMVLQQWMTPSTGDPTQKKMMLIMPIVFTWIFLNLPSGVVLYWLINNILSIGQQLISNRMAE